MRQSLMSKINQLYDIFSEISKHSKLDYSSRYFSALLYTLKNVKYNHKDVDIIKSHIKKNTGMFSSYRGHSLTLLSNMLYMSFGSSEGYVEKLLSYDSILREKGFKKNSFLPLSSFVLLTSTNGKASDREANDIAQKSFEVYSLMKKNHPWVTSSDDYPLSVLLASSSKSAETITEKIEDIYNQLHSKGLSRGNGLQFLSHILSFNNTSTEETTSACFKLYTDLRSSGLKVSPTYYSTLGLITLVSRNSHTLLQDILDVYEYLRSQKGSRRFEKNILIMFASALVTSEYIDNTLDADITSTTLSISLELLIAAQTATITAITAAAAVSATTSSAGV